MCQTNLGVLPLDGEEGVVAQQVPPATAYRPTAIISPRGRGTKPYT